MLDQCQDVIVRIHLTKRVVSDDFWVTCHIESRTQTICFLERTCAKHRILSLTFTATNDIRLRSHWLFNSVSSPLTSFFSRWKKSSRRFFPGVWHFQSTPGSSTSLVPQCTGSTGRKVKLANRNATQSFLDAFLPLAFPTTYNEKFSLPKYCLNFKYTISLEVTRWKKRSSLQHKTSMQKLPWVNTETKFLLSSLKWQKHIKATKLSPHCGVLKLF